MASSPKETARTSLSKKSLSFRWTINDAERSLKFKALRSPCFSVLLRPATMSQPSWNSVWHLYIGVVDSKRVLALSQGWVMNGKYQRRYGGGDCSRNVIISNRRFDFLQPGTQNIVYSVCMQEYDGNDNCDWVIDNEDPILCGSIDEDRLGGFAKYIFSNRLCIRVQADLFFVDYNSADLPDDTSKCMQSMYKINEVFTDDIVIVRCEGQEFKVHQVVLTSQSPVFRAMVDKSGGVIEVSDITPAAMYDLVAYLYSGTAPNLMALVSELLDVAEKYQLPGLLQLCENGLRQSMKETSVVETLILANLHGRKSLKKACFEFIRLNSSKVFLTSEWKDFKSHKDQSLSTEVLEYVLCA